MAVFLRALHVPLTWREIFRRTLYEAFWKDNCLSLAAQLAYYFFFALFPTLLFLVALASYFPVATLIDDMFRTLGGLLPPEALKLITDQLVKISSSRDAGLMSLGVLLAVSSSSAAMIAIIDTLNRAYDVEEVLLRLTLRGAYVETNGALAGLYQGDSDRRGFSHRWTCLRYYSVGGRLTRATLESRGH